MNNDKNLLIQQINELNSTLTTKISPTLKQHEENFAFFKEQIEILQKENSKYKRDNKNLFNENKVQKNLITVLTNQNKKLLKDIKVINERDILLMENMGKIGINQKEKKNLSKKHNKIVKNIRKKNNNDANKMKKQLFEEELYLFKTNQKCFNGYKNKRKIKDDVDIIPKMFDKYYTHINKNKTPNKQLIINIDENNSLYKRLKNRNNTISNTQKTQKKINFKNLRGVRDISATTVTCRTEGTTTCNKMKKESNKFITLKNEIDEICNNNIDTKKKIDNNKTKNLLFKTDGTLNTRKKIDLKQNKNRKNSYQNKKNKKIEYMTYYDDSNINLINRGQDKYNESDNSEIKDKLEYINQSQGKSYLSDYVEDLDAIQYMDENDESN